jgi:hypothetical protein
MFWYDILKNCPPHPHYIRSKEELEVEIRQSNLNTKYIHFLFLKTTAKNSHQIKVEEEKILKVDKMIYVDSLKILPT